MKTREFLSKSYVRKTISYLAIFIVVQLAIIIGMFWSFQLSASRQREEISNNILATFDDTLKNSVLQAETDLQQLMVMHIDTRILSGQQQNARVLVANNLADTLNSFIATNKATDAYIIYNSRNDIFLLSRSDRVEYKELAALREYAQQLSQYGSHENADWHILELDGQNYLLHWYYYFDCYFIAAFHVDTFLDVSSYDKLFDTAACFVLSSPDNRTLSVAGELEVSEPIPGDFYVNSRQLSYGGINASYICLKNYGVATDSLPMFIVALCLSSLVLLIAFVNYLRQEVFGPIDELSETVHIVKQGDYTHRAKLTCSSPEIQELTGSVNSMIDTIINQRIASYENHLKQKNLELKYLQMQLRPHHFLNTLSTISSMSRLGESERIRQFVELYSRDARYLFSASFRAVPLRDEIRHIQDYIDCQSILFPDCVFSFIEVQPEANDWAIPQLMLHTLVENIYKHVVSLDRFTSFFVRAEICKTEDGDLLEITVEDNGAGFTQDVIDRVNTSDGELPMSSHVGLLNISHTLYLMYGRSRLMKLSNKPDNGSMIKILIPKETCLAADAEETENASTRSR